MNDSKKDKLTSRQKRSPKPSSKRSPKRPQPAVTKNSTKHAMEELDRVFHEKARLGILTTIIATPDELNFNEIKELCGLTDGNLNRHLKVLVDNKILSVRKTGSGRNTNSQYRLSEKGHKKFTQYLEALETILKAAQTAPKKSNKPVVQSQRSSDGDIAPSPG